MNLLVINTGSSSVKISSFAVHAGAVEAGTWTLTAEQQLDDAEGWLRQWRQDGGEADCVAHRVVHGGELAQCSLADPDALAAVERCTAFAPLHNPRALRWVRAGQRIVGGSHYLCLDTAFFHTMPRLAKSYALPQAVAEQYGIKRFGFHGLAHQAMWEFAMAHHRRSKPLRKVITVQLGSGCSVAAIKEGRVVDTTMGFSPAEGLMMATRCGDIDSEAIVYLQQQAGWTPEEVSRVLNTQSGLLGVSGISARMQDLLADGSEQARFAVDLFCYRARKAIGAMLAALEGVDALVLGGGISEHQPLIREKILKPLAWSGVVLDAEANTLSEGIITAPSSPLPVLCCAVNENALIADLVIKKRVANHPH